MVITDPYADMGYGHNPDAGIFLIIILNYWTTKFG